MHQEGYAQRDIQEDINDQDEVNNYQNNNSYNRPISSKSRSNMSRPQTGHSINNNNNKNRNA